MKKKKDRDQSDADRMIEKDIRRRGVFSEAVLQALRAVPREAFVPDPHASDAYADGPLPIGSGQTISQPYIVAIMTEWAGGGPMNRVLEVGTGSGYQTAVLARVARRVYSMERIPVLSEAAKSRLKRLGITNVETRTGDGYEGWPEAAPFDAIVVTAAAPQIPPPLSAQLAPGGRLVLPVGEEYGPQRLMRYVLDSDRGMKKTEEMPVRFVPFVRGTA